MKQSSHQHTEPLGIKIYRLVYFDDSCLQIYDRLENKLIIIKNDRLQRHQVECLTIMQTQTSFYLQIVTQTDRKRLIAVN